MWPWVLLGAWGLAPRAAVHLRAAVQADGAIEVGATATGRPVSGESACVNDPAWTRADGRKCDSLKPVDCTLTTGAGGNAAYRSCCASCSGEDYKCTAETDCPIGAVCGEGQFCELAACNHDSDCAAHSEELKCRNSHCRVPHVIMKSEAACVNDPGWVHEGKRCDDFTSHDCELSARVGDNTIHRSCCATCAGDDYKCSADRDCPTGAVCGNGQFCELAACSANEDCKVHSDKLTCHESHCRASHIFWKGESACVNDPAWSLNGKTCNDVTATECQSSFSAGDSSFHDACCASCAEHKCAVESDCPAGSVCGTGQFCELASCTEDSHCKAFMDQLECSSGHCRAQLDVGVQTPVQQQPVHLQPQPVTGGSVVPGETACVNDPSWTQDGKTCNDFSATDCQAKFSAGDHALHKSCCASCAGDEYKCTANGGECPTGAVCGTAQLCELAACSKDSDCDAHADGLVCGRGYCRVPLPPERTGPTGAPHLGWQGESACVNDPGWELNGKTCGDFSPNECEQRFAAGDKSLHQACCASCAGNEHQCTADGDCPRGAVCGSTKYCELAACVADSDCSAVSRLLACSSGHCRAADTPGLVGELDLAVPAAGVAALQAMSSRQLESAVRPALATELQVSAEEVEILQVTLLADRDELLPAAPVERAVPERTGPTRPALLALKPLSQSLVALSPPAFSKQAETLCGTGGFCDGKNRLYIGPDHKHYQLAADEGGKEDTSGCEATCKAHETCGGFYVQRDRLDAEGKPVCYFVVNPACRFVDDATADCYRFVGSARTAWQPPAVSDTLTIAVPTNSFETMEGHPQIARARLVQALAKQLKVRQDQVQILRTDPDLLGHGANVSDTAQSLAQLERGEKDLQIWFSVTPDADPTEPQDVEAELSALHDGTKALALADEVEVDTSALTPGVLRIKFSLPKDLEPHLPADIAQVLGTALGVPLTSVELRWD